VDGLDGGVEVSKNQNAHLTDDTLQYAHIISFSLLKRIETLTFQDLSRDPQKILMVEPQESNTLLYFIPLMDIVKAMSRSTYDEPNLHQDPMFSLLGM
jgi:hypothetical protein